MIRKKVKSAVTDSGSEVRRARRQARRDEPDRHHLVASGESAEAIEAGYDGEGYGDSRPMSPKRSSRCSSRSRRGTRELRDDPGELLRLLAVGADKARETSAPTLRRCTSAWASSALAARLERSTSPGSSSRRLDGEVSA